MDLNGWFDKGMSIADYTESMEKNKEGMLDIYREFELTEPQQAALEPLRQQQLRVIAITEDWCGDAMLNNPILIRIAEAAGMEVRFLARDQNFELMDQYLTNGTARAIPIYIFISPMGEEAAVWGPRAELVQELVDRGRAGLPEKDNPEFEGKQKAFYTELLDLYRTDRGIWQTVSDSMINRLGNVLE